MLPATKKLYENVVLLPVILMYSGCIISRVYCRLSLILPFLLNNDSLLKYPHDIDALFVIAEAFFVDHAVLMHQISKMR